VTAWTCFVLEEIVLFTFTALLCLLNLIGYLVIDSIDDMDMSRAGGEYYFSFLVSPLFGPEFGPEKCGTYLTFDFWSGVWSGKVPTFDFW
jgi:hypothetical protein